MADNLSVEVKAKLLEATFLSFTTTAIADSLTEVLPYDGYEFLNEITYVVIKDQNIIETHVKITIINKDNKDVLGTILTKFSMFIENFDECVIQSVGDRAEFLPYAFMIGASTAISTTRGMLVTASANSTISNALLPLTDASKFIPTSKNTIINKLV